VASELVWAIVAAAVIGAGLVLYNAWRHPEKACRRCDGSSWVKSFSLFTRRSVRGGCRKCGTRGWYPRRLSRFFGWDANIHRW
jgi:hypothetical protein